MRYVLVATALLLLNALLLSACSGAYDTEEHEDSNNTDYQIRLSLRTGEEGTCEELTVRIQPAPKLYEREPPPARTVLYDDDCKEPLSFERIRYLSADEKSWVYLSDQGEIARFEGDYERMMNDVYGFVWRTLDGRD